MSISVIQLMQTYTTPDLVSLRVALHAALIQHQCFEQGPGANRQQVLEFIESFRRENGKGSENWTSPQFRFFEDLIFGDFFGFGPIDLLLQQKEWFSLTISGAHLKIDLIENEHSVPVTLPLGIICESLLLKNLSTLILNPQNARLDEKFPLYRGCWERYLIEAAIPPVSTTLWMRFSNIPKINEILPSWKYQ